MQSCSQMPSDTSPVSQLSEAIREARREVDAVVDSVSKEHKKLIRAMAALDDVGITVPKELRDKIGIKSEELANAQVGNLCTVFLAVR